MASVLGLLGSAGAQPAAEPADPEAPLESLPEAELDPRAAGYPRTLVDRPLVLPDGLLEGTVVLGVGYADGGTWTTRIGPSLRYGVGRVELEGGASVLVDDWYSDAFVAVRFAPDPDMTIGLQLGLERIGSDVTTTTPRVLLGRKQLLTETVAIESSFGPGVSRAAGETAFVANGEVRVQIQVAALYAVQARAALNLRYLEAEGTTLRHDYGLGLLASITPTIDVMSSVDLFVEDDDYVGLVVSVAVSLRNRSM